MADAVAVTTIEDGARRAVFYLTNISDGSGEANVKKIDVSALSSLQDGTSCTGVRITKITYSNVGMGVKLTFDATTDVLAIQLPADLSDQLDYSGINGLPDYSGSGKQDICC